MAEHWHPAHQALDSSRSSIETKPNQMEKEIEPNPTAALFPGNNLGKFAVDSVSVFSFCLEVNK